MPVKREPILETPERGFKYRRGRQDDLFENSAPPRSIRTDPVLQSETSRGRDSSLRSSPSLRACLVR
jgi:hypothetical protein